MGIGFPSDRVYRLQVEPTVRDCDLAGKQSGLMDVRRLDSMAGGAKITEEKVTLADRLHSALRPRMLLPGDGEACARLMRKITPLDDKLDRTLAKVLDELLEEERLIGGLIVDYDAAEDRTVVAATLSAFVSPEFRQTYLDKPWPCLTNWLLLRCLKGHTRVFLDRAAQAQGNLAGGLIW